MSSKRSFRMFSDDEFQDESNDFETNSYYEEKEDISDIVDNIIEPVPKAEPKKKYSTGSNVPPQPNTGTPNGSYKMGQTTKKLGKNVFEKKVYEFSEKIADYVSPKNMSPAAKQATYIAVTWGISELIKKYFDKK